jgi:hypothetical protein
MEFEKRAYEFGFAHTVCDPLVRSSYHADEQASLFETSRPGAGSKNGPRFFEPQKKCGPEFPGRISTLLPFK